MSGKRFFIAGGAGFIGSHFTDRLLCDQSIEAVTLYDNFSSGREWHYAHHEQDRRLRVICGDVKDLAALERNKGTSNERGIATLAFSIDRRGGVHHARIARSSGSSLLDNETMAMLERAAPLPPPPPEIAGAEIPIEVPIRYNMR